LKTLLTVVIIFFASIPSFSQNPFKDFNFLIGKWQGVETGVAGDGIGFRTYEYDLNKYVIVEKNMSTFPKSEKKPRGEVHRDFGVVSYNSNDSLIVFRQFFIEGYTSIYVLDKAASTTEKFVFVTREIENNPGNWKSRSTLYKISDSEFKETFEIAKDGINYNKLLENYWMKVE
jgi:hypothetical protein